MWVVKMARRSVVRSHYTPWVTEWEKVSLLSNAVPAITKKEWYELLFARNAAEHGFSLRYGHADPWSASLRSLRGTFYLRFSSGVDSEDEESTIPLGEYEFRVVGTLLTWLSKSGVDMAIALDDENVRLKQSDACIIIQCEDIDIAISLHSIDIALCEEWYTSLEERREIGRALKVATEAALPTAGLRSIMSAQISAVASALRASPLARANTLEISPTAALRTAISSAVRMELWQIDGEWESSTFVEAEDRYTLRLIFFISALTIAQRNKAIDAAAMSCGKDGFIPITELFAVVSHGMHAYLSLTEEDVGRHLTSLHRLKARLISSQLTQCDPSFLEICAVIAMITVDVREQQLEALLTSGEDSNTVSADYIQWIARAFAIPISRQYFAFFLQRGGIPRSSLRVTLNELAFEARDGPFLLPLCT